jgi:hypothetical protein
MLKTTFEINTNPNFKTDAMKAAQERLFALAKGQQVEIAPDGEPEKDTNPDDSTAG